MLHYSMNIMFLFVFTSEIESLSDSLLKNTTRKEVPQGFCKTTTICLSMILITMTNYNDTKGCTKYPVLSCSEIHQPKSYEYEDPKKSTNAMVGMSDFLTSADVMGDFVSFSERTARSPGAHLDPAQGGIYSCISPLVESSAGPQCQGQTMQYLHFSWLFIWLLFCVSVHLGRASLSVICFFVCWFFCICCLSNLILILCWQMPLDEEWEMALLRKSEWRYDYS